MRIAIISDIHGNLVALEAALADIAEQGVDQIVCLGDVAMDGPQPREVIARLRALGCPVVMGNADAWLLDPPPFDTTKEGDAARMEAIYHWSAAQVTEEEKAFIRSFQPTVTIDLSPSPSPARGGGPESPPSPPGKGAGGLGPTLLCFHGTPRSYDEIIKATTPDDELDRVFAGVAADALAGGHTHSQLLRRWRGALLLNPGSVGLPFDANPPDEGPFPGIHNPAWAEYLLLTRDGRRLSVDLRRAPYDVEEVRRAILGCGMPNAEWFASDWVAG